MKKLSNTEAELKISVAYKKKACNAYPLSVGFNIISFLFEAFCSSLEILKVKDI